MLQRTLKEKLLSINEQYPCLLLTGARQVGKSTLLDSCRPLGMEYLTLDDPRLCQLAQDDPVTFLEEHPAPLCIDEVQYAPQLFSVIKMRVDEQAKERLHSGQQNSSNGALYWLTGSQRFHLMKGITESLAGRLAILDLFSLSQHEALGCGELDTPFMPEAIAMKERQEAWQEHACETAALFGRIWRGGYPRLVTEPSLSPDDYFKYYLQSYLEQDVQQLTQVGNQGAFLKLLQSAASRTGQQLNYSTLATDAGVSVPTAKNWVGILEASGVICLLPPYKSSTSKRLASRPKLYFMDTGLCAWLCGWRSAGDLMQSAFAGAFLETWVFGQLYRSYAHNGQDLSINTQLSYYRDGAGKEVDFVLERNGQLYPMEVKKSSNPAASDLKAALSIPLRPGIQLAPGVVFSTAQEIFALGQGHYSYPSSLLESTA